VARIIPGYSRRWIFWAIVEELKRIGIGVIGAGANRNSREIVASPLQVELNAEHSRTHCLLNLHT
jgi:hypothetical protein